MYALGVMLFVMLMGYPPFPAVTSAELLRCTVEERVLYDKKDWAAVSSDAQLLVKNMLIKDPANRLSIDEVLSFVWVRDPPPPVRAGRIDEE